MQKIGWLEALAELGWSQALLAREVGVSEQTVLNWKGGGAPAAVERWLSDLVQWRRAGERMVRHTLRGQALVVGPDGSELVRR